MPATAVTVTRPTIDGVTVPAAVASDATNGNVVPNLAGLILTLNNTDASNPHTINFVTPVTHGGYAVADKSVVLAASTVKAFSNFPSESFGRNLQFTTGSATVTISAVAPAS
jgi:hypothetical protein